MTWADGCNNFAREENPISPALWHNLGLMGCDLAEGMLGRHKKRGLKDKQRSGIE